MINPALIPDPDPIAAAAPLWLFRALLLLTFFMHLIPMNLILGGSLLMVWARLRPQLAIRDDLIRWFTRAMPIAVAATVTFGVAPLLFSQVLYGRLLYSSSILIGWWWLAVIPMLIVAYYSVYLAVFREDRISKRIGVTLSLLVASILSLISFIYSTNMSLMLRPQSFEAKYQSAPWGTGLNLVDPTMPWRWMHMVLGAIAVAALALAWHGYIQWKRDRQPAYAMYRYGMGAFAVTTALNLVVGTVFLLSFPREVLLDLLRYSPAGTVELVAGFAAGFIALGLAVLALQDRRTSMFLGSTLGAVLVTLVLMILLRDSLRHTILATTFQPVSRVEPQWALIALFGILLLAAMAAVGWMLARLRIESRT